MSNSIFSVIGSQTRQLLGEKLNLKGGTLTGSLILSADPQQNSEAATKNYVDTKVTQLTQYARLDGATFTGDIQGTNLTLSGNLTVKGNITAVETSNTTITDSIIALAKGTAGSANATNDSGILIERGSTEQNAAVYWDEGDDVFKFVTTTSDATATDLGATSTVCDVVIKGLNTNGNDLGTIEEFYAGLLIASGSASIPKAEFDAVANGGIVTITDGTSPFATATIETTYSSPEELVYEIIEGSDDGTNSVVSVELKSISGAALSHFRGAGTITINSSEVTFS